MPITASFESFEKELTRLVGIFERGLAEFKRPGYVEAQLRDDFLNPFFRALGWDLENRAGLIQSKREVEIESRTEIGGRQKRADYLFRTNGRDSFVCEAKKPAEDLHSRYAFQAKRYAWNKGLPLAILSDFEEFKIYVVGGKPYLDDPLVGLWKTWHFRELPLVAKEIWNLLARDKVAGGSIDRLLEGLPKRPTGTGRARQQWLIKPDRTRSLDVEFLNLLDEARRELASDLLKHNDRADLLEGTKLNEAVQLIIDRILFLRICEDRDIDTGVPLVAIVEKWRRNYGKEDGRRAHQKPLELLEEPPPMVGYGGIRAPKDSLWRAIVSHFRALDRRPPTLVPYFNGNLFKEHFSEELIVGDEWLAGFVADLSDEESPYLFSYIPVEILGTIYERFLGKTVRPQGRGMTIEEKPDVRKAGGVYYTPRYIVEYIVAQTVEKLLRNTKPEATLKLHFLDPACGSGSFLLRVFEVTCEYWQQWFMDHPNDRKKKWCWMDEKSGNVHLTLSLKRQILTSNVFGVDLDPGAVEVTQLSLYLKMLEHENRATLRREHELFPGEDEALLPPLEHNIKCGNSLIAADFFTSVDDLFHSSTKDDLLRVKAFDWKVGFKEVMQAGGFDAVVGNPPYVLVDNGAEKLYMQRAYASDEGKPDLFKYFVEQAHKLARPKGKFGMIIPASFLQTPAYKRARRLLLERATPESVVVFKGPVFAQASVNCIVLITGLGVSKNAELNWIEDSADNPSAASLRTSSARRAMIDLSAWYNAPDYAFVGPRRATAAWITKMQENSNSLGGLGQYTLGMQVYHNTMHAKQEIADRVHHSKLPRGKSWLPESGGKNVHRYDFAGKFDEWVKYGDCCYNRPEPKFISGPRIVIREITGETLVCTLTNSEHVPNKAIIIFRSELVNLKFILGILNSRAVGKYVAETTEKGTQRLFPRISLKSIRELPIPKIDRKRALDKARHDRLVGLVDKMLALTPELRHARNETERQTLQNAATATDQQIDALVYELYGLTEKEIKLVEGSK